MKDKNGIETIIEHQRIHPIWDEQGLNFNVVGKYQYFYNSDKGQISLIELPNYFRDGIDYWEINDNNGHLIEDVERFKSKIEAEKRIYELL